MLDNQVYLGHMIGGKTKRPKIRSTTSVPVPEKDWIVVQNTHEPLVSEKVWNDAHARLSSRKRAGKTGEVSMFAGLLKCDTCGHTLTASNPQNGPSCFFLEKGLY